MRRAAKADDNQPQIVQAFRRLGFSVQHLHTVGKGCPDILIGRAGLNFLIEIKDGSKCESKRKLTKDEQDFFKIWRGQVCVIESVEQAIEFSNNLIKI